MDENDIGVAFEALYDMRFYNDRGCADPYQARCSLGSCNQ